MAQKWHEKASVQTALVSGFILVILTTINSYNQHFSDKINELEKDKQRLEIEIAPFKAIASNRFGSNEKQSMHKLLDEIKKEQTQLNKGLNIITNNLSILLSSSQREYAYSLAMIKALSSFVKSYGPGGVSSKTSEVHNNNTGYLKRESSFFRTKTFRNRIVVNISSSNKETSEGNIFVNKTKENIEIIFMNTVSNSMMPRKLNLVMETTKDVSKFIESESFPDRGTFSPMELLIELNLSGFNIVNLLEIENNNLLLTIRNQDYNSTKEIKVNFK